MSQERIVLLDPRGKLASVREVLSRFGFSVEGLRSHEALVSSCLDHRSSPRVTVVVVDGDPESGIDPVLSPRLGEAVPELPPVVLA
ncbi:MAG: hypothetical protein ACREN5_01670, partial [Gemmatimonadales bacterium]